VAPANVLPAVLINDLPTENVIQAIEERLSSFARLDDVFQSAFGNNLVIVATASGSPWLDLATQLNSSGRFSGIYRTQVHPTDVLPSGPYFLQGNSIHQAWRLYPDELDAFIFSVIPEDLRHPNRYVSLQKSNCAQQNG
jgi:hypothetical protein